MQEQNKTLPEDSEKDFNPLKVEETRLIITKQKLLEAGTCFGHFSKNWNPKMREFLLASQGPKSETAALGKLNGIHLINVAKTQEALDIAYRLVFNLAQRGVTFLFVGTKPQAKEVILEQALRTESPYVNERWLGGTLTNSRAIFSRVRELEKLEKLRELSWLGYTKKEALFLEKQLQKLTKNLKGIRNMRSLPQIMIVADPLHDSIAVREAKKRGVKVIGILDSNADPHLVDFGIPANDDSLRSLTLIITLLADAIIEARGQEPKFAFRANSDIQLPEELDKNLQSLIEISAKKQTQKPRVKTDVFQAPKLAFAEPPKDRIMPSAFTPPFHLKNKERVQKNISGGNNE